MAPTPTPTPLPFAIDTDILGRGTCVIDGRDVSADIAGVSVTVTPGQPTRVALYQDRPGRVTGEGIVEVHSLSDTEIADAVRALDPAKVRAGIDDLMLSMGDDQIGATIAVIAALLEDHG